MELTDLSGRQQHTLVAASEHHGVIRDHSSPAIQGRGRMTLVLRDTGNTRVQFHVQGLGRSSSSADFFDVRWVMITCLGDPEALKMILQDVLRLPSERLARLTALHERLSENEKLVYEAERQNLRRLPLGGNLTL